MSKPIKKRQGKKCTYCCIKHDYTRRSEFGGLCPICREKLKCMGSKWRISKDGDFDKVERKTRKFNGQKPIVTQRQRRLRFKRK
jgi:hypothetical protein